jgi:hypothetical protein
MTATMTPAEKKTVLLIAPAVKVTPKALREIEAAGYIVLRALPTDVSVLGAPDPRIIRGALQMLLSNHAVVTPQTWRAWVMERLGADALKAAGGAIE